MMRRLLRFLLVPETPLWKYCLCLLPAAIVPSFLLGVLALFVAESAGVDVVEHMPPPRAFTPGVILRTVIIGPAIETLLLAGALKLLSATPLRPASRAAVCAVLAGCAHSLAAALWFFGTVWSFFVFSCAYIAWRRTSFARAWSAAFVPHALVNSVVMLYAWIASDLGSAW